MNTKPSSRSTVRSLLLALILAVVPLSPATGRDPTVVRLVVLHTNDIHSHLLPDREGRGGLARIGGYVEQVRAREDHVLFLDAGDAVGGTPVSSVFTGRPIFHVMSVMGIDALAVGNHEFDHGWKRIDDYREIATFPLLCANATAPERRRIGDADWTRFEIGGLKIGVIGVITEVTPEITVAGATDGVTFEKPADAVRRLLPEVRAASDIVILLAHLGHDEECALAREVRGIDLVVGGHSHTVVKEPVREKETVVLQAGGFGHYVGRVEIAFDVERRRIIRIEGELVEVNAKLPVSARVRDAVETWEEKVAEQVDVVVGRAKRRLDRDALRDLIEETFRTALATDIGFQNSGGIRAELTAGDIRIRDLWNVLPFDNTLVAVRVKGSKLPAWATNRMGDVNPDGFYTVATSSFVAGHADRYFPDGIEGMTDSGRGIRRVFIEAVRRAGVLP
jgi:2',3'-cyclic-nucleotide 2'-phosphodiesterase (5'-nucleotidase family)